MNTIKQEYMSFLSLYRVCSHSRSARELDSGEIDATYSFFRDTKDGQVNVTLSWF